jgi:hypothetical protein
MPSMTRPLPSFSMRGNTACKPKKYGLLIKINDIQMRMGFVVKTSLERGRCVQRFVAYAAG